MSRVLVIPDLHVPFTKEGYLEFCRRLKKNYKPDITVILGDVVDFYAFSQYDKDPDASSPGDELKATKALLKPWFSLFPEALVCFGNHETRLMKKLSRAGIPMDARLAFEAILECPKGWTWASTHEIDGVQYIHGDGFVGKMAHINAAERYGKSTVIGHCHHSAGVVFLDRIGGSVFGMNAGCGIDADAHAFAYAKNVPYRPVISAGVVRDGKYPQVIPMG